MASEGTLTGEAALLIHAALDARLAETLRVELSSQYDVRWVRNLRELRKQQINRETDVLVVDPIVALNGDAFRQSAADLGRFLSGIGIPVVVVVTKLTNSRDLKTVIEIGKSCDFEPVVNLPGDDIGGLRTALELVVREIVPRRCLELLVAKSALSSDSQLDALVRLLFRKPVLFGNEVQLTRITGLSAGRINQRLRQVQLRSFEHVRTAARVASALPFLNHTRLNVSHVAQKCGCRSPDTLTRAVRLVLARTPAKLRVRCDPSELIDRIVAYCLHTGDGKTARIEGSSNERSSAL